MNQPAASSARIEIHGLRQCPFAWRTRVAAHLKGVAYEWLPYDALDDDERRARASAHNPDRRSPLLWEEGWALTESSVICAYLDESRPGTPLQPPSPRDRAAARLAIAEAGGLMTNPHAPLDDEVKKRVDGAMGKLEARLADGRAFFDGDAPGIVDAHVWPGLAALEGRGVTVGEPHQRLRAYWERAKGHPAFVATRP